MVDINKYYPHEGISKGKWKSQKDFKQIANYNAHPNTKPIVVTYIDDTDKKILAVHKFVDDSELRKQLMGYFQNQIAVFEDNNYRFVPNGGKKRSLRESHDYDLHFVHGTDKVERSKIVHETIHYLYENGSQAYQDYEAVPASFTQTGTRDRVTNKITWDKLDDYTFGPVISPWIMGYTASPAIVKSQTVCVDQNDFHADQDINVDVRYELDKKEQRIALLFLLHVELNLDK